MASISVPVVLGDRSYDITIQSGLLGELGGHLRRLGAKGTVCIVTDRTVGGLYAPTAVRSIRRAGLGAQLVTVPAGERAKSLVWLGRVLDRFVEARLERSSFLVALGGGVVGDLTGFAAASYLRGIPFVQVPTTVVAQVDSSVGGKTGINHPQGKNLIGAFYQPRAVLVDPSTLRTLPLRQRLGGVAEVIKYGVIADQEFFVYLERTMSSVLKMDEDTIAKIIQRSCEIKAEVVASDEREGDRRRILNYGHTIGHALETLGHYRALIHGEAVAIGMVQEAWISHKLGYCRLDVPERILTLVEAAGLPSRLPRCTERQLWDAMQHDKKVVQGQVHGVWPERIGAVRIAPIGRSTFARWYRTRTRD
ncbi:3-dehydroquinate synthase [Nitrospira sp.]|nr:3-dehydroquinate synthase [Nitrospira sp.]